MVRVPIPALTEERQKNLVKHIHKVLENHRTGGAQYPARHQGSGGEAGKGEKNSEDDRKRTLDELEKVTHAEKKKVEDLSAVKEKEVSGI